jgi:hypothetical protein
LFCAKAPLKKAVRPSAKMEECIASEVFGEKTGRGVLFLIIRKIDPDLKLKF